MWKNAVRTMGPKPGSETTIEMPRSPAFVLLILVLGAGLGCASDPEVPTLPGGLWGEGTPPKTAALFDPALGDGFFSFPWPSDARVTEAGAPDLSTFPNHGSGDLLEVYTDTAMELVVGFGTNPSIHVRFDGDLDPANLPSPLDTLTADSPVQLLDVDPDSPERGRRIPLLLHLQDGDGTYIADQTLCAFPAVGFPLRSETTYAYVVLDSLGDADGLPLVVLDELQESLEGEGDPDLAQAYAPLADALDGAGLARETLAVATVFTTQDATGELRAIRDWVAEPANLAAPEVTAFGSAGNLDDFEFMSVYEGSYETPIFQRGQTPYATAGGGFEFQDGQPVVQRWESVGFHLTVPVGEPPVGGFPLVLALPGTGGESYQHFHPHEPTSQGMLLSERGVATFGFEPPLSGSRGEDDGVFPDLMSYNVANPESSRSLFRQEAVDASVAIRFLRESLAPAHPELSLDTTRIGYFGHSQGGHAGCLLASVEPELDPVFFNGMGGLLSYTLIQRKDPLDFEAMIRVAVGETEAPLTVFHPVLDIVQLLADVVDPINYGRSWYLDAVEGEGTSVLQSAGYLDAASPFITVNGLTVASGNPPVAPLDWEIPELGWVGLEPQEMPYSGNVSAADGEVLTAGLLTHPDAGHQLIWDDEDTAWTAAEFLATGLVEGLPVVRGPDGD